MSDPSIIWLEPTAQGPRLGDPSATIALDGAAWVALGATFTRADDGQGETPLLSAATVITANGPIDVGIVDYGEPVTYLLVAGADPDRRSRTSDVLGTLVESGAVQADAVVDIIAEPPSLDERVAELERQLEHFSRRAEERSEQQEQTPRGRKRSLNKIRIRLKAYDTSAIESAAKEIVETATRTGAAVHGPVPLPIGKNVYCVIRSPYKDKDAREHFEICTHKRLIDIHRPIGGFGKFTLGEFGTVIEISETGVEPKPKRYRSKRPADR